MLQNIRSVDIAPMVLVDQDHRSAAFAPAVAGLVFSALLSQERPDNDPGFVDLDLEDDPRFDIDGSLHLDEADLIRAIAGLSKMHERVENSQSLGRYHPVARQIRGIGVMLARQMPWLIADADTRLIQAQTPDRLDASEGMRLIFERLDEKTIVASKQQLEEYRSGVPVRRARRRSYSS